MRRFIPLAHVGSRLTLLRFHINDGCALSCPRDRRYGSLCCSRQCDAHGLLPTEPMRIALAFLRSSSRKSRGKRRKVRSGSYSGRRAKAAIVWKSTKAGEMLRAQIVGAVRIDSRQRQLQVIALDIVGELKWLSRKILEKIEACVGRDDVSVLPDHRTAPPIVHGRDQEESAPGRVRARMTSQVIQMSAMLYTSNHSCSDQPLSPAPAAGLRLIRCRVDPGAVCECSPIPGDAHL